MNWAIRSAYVTILGIVLSGPLAVMLVNATHPQPDWQGASTYAAHYHPLQVVPYLGGIVLVVALVCFVSALHSIKHSPRTQAAMIFTAVFATLIFGNYIVQSTFLPYLATHYEDANAPILAALSMANPTSLAWGIEMWGWAFLGIATWLCAPVFHGSALERATAWCFAANGAVSIAGGLLTTLRPGWVMTPMGLAMFAMWNLLLLVMCALAAASLSKREAPHAFAA